MVKSVLLIEVDLFRSIGGGPTVYGALIRSQPDVRFHYFRRAEAAEAPRPANARPILLQPGYPDPLEEPAAALRPFLDPFRTAMDLARSVAAARAAGSAPGRFDVVDTPDYRCDGLFIRYALQAHGIEVDRVALALHGVRSSALASAWPWSGDAGRLFAGLHLCERLQYRAVDVRYGLSAAYAEALERRFALGVNRLDPLAVIRPTAPVLSPVSDRAPDIAFVGRKARRKGPDLLLDALWWAPPGTWRDIRLIGPDGENHQGGGSAEPLLAIAAARGLRIRDEPALSQPALQALCRDKTILAAPSRYDPFNLVALEGLLDGCPTLAGRNTGVARWIGEELPGLQDLVSDWACDRSVAGRIHDIARDYDRVRARVAEAVARAELRPDLAGVGRIYADGRGGDARVQRRLHALAERLMLAGRFLERREGRPALPRDPVILAGGAAGLLAERSEARRAGRRDGLQRRASGFAFALRHPLLAARRVAETRLTASMPGPARQEVQLIAGRPGVIRQLTAMPEKTDRQVSAKIAYLNVLVAERRTDRARGFAELARLERARGNRAIAAAYELRLLRWMGGDRFQRLPSALHDLRAEGYGREAEAAEALYARPAEARARGQALLAEQRARWRTLPGDRPLQRLEDRRGAGAPRVSVIVSLYDAAGRLPRFLRMLEAQTLLRAGAAEVILVDSGSPADERGAWLAAWGGRAGPVVYARSAERETIQAAWNRGVRLARGDYLAFLGADEGLRPDGLERLAAALDADPQADWAMADTLVTQVDRHGVFARDVMVHDREGYRPSYVYLDSTYLGYVGGLYRRNLHDRFGWYDEDFRAAGGTEWKTRILPYIRTVRVPERLGVLNDDLHDDLHDRTGRSPRAEIEDLRAWRLRRSEAGMEDALAGAPEGEVRALLAACLDYRRSYSTARSTDLDLALVLARQLQRRSGGAEGGMLAQALAAAAEDLHQIELWRTPELGVRAQYRLAGLLKRVRSGLAPAAERLGASAAAVGVFNDSRYEQDHGSWSRP